MIPPPAGLATLLGLRLLLVRNRLRSLGASGWVKLLGMGLLTLVFLVAEGVLAWLLFNSIQHAEDFAALFVLALVQRLLALVFLACLSMLFFSNVTASLATIYLSRDLDLLLATPIATERVFALKFLETLLNSSYMVVLFAAPILVALGLVFGAPVLFYLQIPFVLFLLILPPGAAGILLTMVLMRFLPARRTYQALSAVGFLLTISLITALRVVAPEKLLRPTTNHDFAAVLRALTVPAAAYLPSTWAADLELALVQSAPRAALAALLPLAGLALFAVVVSWAGAHALYFRGVVASHEAGRRRPKEGPPTTALLGFAARDLRLFFRDPAQWSQLLLLGALVIVYVFNITALPQDMMVVGALVTVRDVIAWVNVGLASFVMAAVGMRFVLPSISSEGGAFWVVASSPANRRTYLYRKLALFLPPMLGFALVLVALSGRALHVDLHTQVLSLVTVAVTTTTLTTLAVGLGAALPSFKLEHPAQFVLTAGGVLYGVLALFYVVAVVALEAKPFFSHLLAQTGRLDSAVDPWPYYGLILSASALLATLSLHWGLRRFSTMEL